MSDETQIKVHWSFWVIGAVALIWNIMGVANFFVQMLAPDLAALPEWWRAVVESRPSWALGAMVIAVFGGALGCILLLLRKSSAYSFFVASLFGTVLTIVHALGVPGAGPRQIFEAAVMPIVVAVLLIWYARRAIGKLWIS